MLVLTSRSFTKQVVVFLDGVALSPGVFLFRQGSILIDPLRVKDNGGLFGEIGEG
jgi:hypothetical protein